MSRRRVEKSESKLPITPTKYVTRAKEHTLDSRTKAIYQGRVNEPLVKLLKSKLL